LCGNDFRIHQQLSVRASENSDISTSTQKHADIAAKVLNRNFRCSGRFEGSSDEASILFGDHRLILPVAFA